MFERFTEFARQVVVLAQEEARTLKHNYIGTEHILLGLLREEGGVAARVLESLGVTVERARAELNAIVGAGEEASPGQIPFTPRAKKVLELALREALNLGHNYIGTEHILLGLLREEEGLAARVLESLDITAERVRAQVVRIVGSGEEVTSGQIPFTPRAKKVLELALREALSLDHNYIGTEHILLGLVRENDGGAARVLLDLGADADQVRRDVLHSLDPSAAAVQAREEPVPRDPGPGGREIRAAEHDPIAGLELPLSEGSREVLALAREEARTLGHNYMGTEHLLLGLLEEGDGLAAGILELLDISAVRVRPQVVRIVGSGEVLADGLFPLTPRCRTVLEHAQQEATRFGHGHIGTEHLLLGLGREREGVAARILMVFDVDPDKVRSEVVRMLARPDDTPRAVDELKPPADSGDLAAGASRLIEPLARPIEGQLGRPADAGDLLVALASIPEGLVGRALAGLGIGPEVLSPAVDEARRAHGHTGLLPPSALTAEIDTVRKERFAKLAAQHFEEASELRQRERQLVDQARELEQRALDDALAETRKRLGLTG